MLGDHKSALHVDGDSGDLGAVNLSETVEGHIAVGTLATADTDETTGFAYDTSLVEVGVVANHIVGTVGFGGLLFDVLLFLLVGSGQVADILVELLDDDLVVLQFGEELGNLRLLLGDTLFLTGDQFLKAGALFGLGIDLCLEAGNLLAVGGHQVLNVLNLGTDLALDVRLAFHIGATQFLNSIVARVDSGQILFNLIEGGKERIEFSILVLDNQGERVVCLDGSVQLGLVGVASCKNHGNHGER